MGHNFLSISADPNDFMTVRSPEINKFVLDNNETILRKAYSFFQRSENLLLITGFFGTGKTQIVNHVLSYIDRSVHSLKFHCSPATKLDDMMLNIWAQLILISSDSEIKAHIVAPTFQEKINSFFADTSSNIVITLYNYDLVADENSSDIIDFLALISNNENVKIIITAKVFDTTILPGSISYSKLILKALSRVIFEKFIKDNELKATPRTVDELYKITRGYYFYTLITIKILLQKNLSMTNYLVAYTNSAMSFDKFLAKAFVSMLPIDVKKTLLWLSMIRHMCNSKMLDCIESYDKYAVDYLKENKFITVVGDNIFVNNYFISTLFEDYTESELIPYHISLAKFYNEQLSLKPSERAVLLSRNTMRAELEFHKNLCSIKQIPNDSEKQCDNNDVLNSNYSVDDLLSIAETYRDEYKYSDAVKIYLSILEKQDEFASPMLKYEVYEKLAALYDILAKWKYSLHYYGLLSTYYKAMVNSEKLDIVKLKIANIYYKSYKTTEAVNLLYEIISESTNSGVTINAYTTLGNLYIALAAKDKAYELYSKAIALTEREDNSSNLSELYFKFAILSDEKEETDIAVKYYEKCIQVAENSDKYKSLSYSNLGDLYLDFNKRDKALLMFESAYKCDELNKNAYGMYYSASNISKLMVRSDSSKALEFMIKAQKAAKDSNDIFAIANSSLHLGDYYCNNENVEYGIKEYLDVLKLVKNKFSEDNKKKIFARLDDAKCRIGIEKYTELVKLYE